jgi:cbb3-type cytochrome oxidase maturation protein
MTVCLIASGLVMAAGAAFFFVAAARSGQFDDMEEEKYRMLREDENQ